MTDLSNLPREPFILHQGDEQILQLGLEEDLKELSCAIFLGWSDPFYRNTARFWFSGSAFGFFQRNLFVAQALLLTQHFIRVMGTEPFAFLIALELEVENGFHVARVDGWRCSGSGNDNVWKAKGLVGR